MIKIEKGIPAPLAKNGGSERASGFNRRSGSPKGHSLLGASGAARWLACSGSFHLSQLTGPDEESEHAALGTAALVGEG
jgi:hypothetical protein